MLDEMGGAESFGIDLENDIVRPALVAHDGEITWPPPAPPTPVRPEPDHAKEQPEPWSESKAQEPPAAVRALKKHAGLLWITLAAIAIVLVGWGAPEDGSFLTNLTVFVLACFVGWQVVWNVTPALHTPLMSVTNAISGIIVIGGMLHLAGDLSSPATILGLIAVLIAAINISGGFLVTRRMLAMFHK